ncbi:MAG: hypothetical protein DRP26_04900, partial [Candidatus Zixiibacteriota bacterium]
DILTKQGKKNLTGFYVAGSFSGKVSIAIVEGGFTLWAGVGFFGPTISDNVLNPSTSFLGHAGLELYGGLLGGLISASAWAELLAETTVPANPLDFKICLTGTLGVEACAIIWCVSWQGTIHIDDTGIGTGGCY